MFEKEKQNNEGKPNSEFESLLDQYLPPRLKASSIVEGRIEEHTAQGALVSLTSLIASNGNKQDTATGKHPVLVPNQELRALAQSGMELQVGESHRFLVTECTTGEDETVYLSCTKLLLSELLSRKDDVLVKITDLRIKKNGSHCTGVLAQIPGIAQQGFIPRSLMRRGGAKPLNDEQLKEMVGETIAVRVLPQRSDFDDRSDILLSWSHAQKESATQRVALQEKSADTLKAGDELIATPFKELPHGLLVSFDCGGTALMPKAFVLNGKRSNSLLEKPMSVTIQSIDLDTKRIRVVQSEWLKAAQALKDANREQVYSATVEEFVQPQSGGSFALVTLNELGFRSKLASGAVKMYNQTAKQNGADALCVGQEISVKIKDVLFENPLQPAVLLWLVLPGAKS